MHPVGISLRMRILGVLGDGPMTLVRLLSSIQSDRAPSPTILALACSDLLELDLVMCPLCPETIARCRHDRPAKQTTLPAPISAADEQFVASFRFFRATVFQDANAARGRR